MATSQANLQRYESLLVETQERRSARQSLLSFTRQIAIEPEPVHHHRVLIEKLQQVIDGTLSRLMVFMPPGTAKSTYSSVLLPACYLGVHNKRRVIAGSYDTGLSTLFGRKVRNLVNGPDYRRIFPIEVAGDTRAKGEWDLSTGGGYYATGVGSAVTGRRGHLGILDDLIKGRKDADSPTVRDSTWEWFKSDFRTRLIPDNNAIVFIMTRWHEDDPAGRILPEDWNGESGLIRARDGEIWDVLCIPAQAGVNDALGRKEGDWLWTEWFSEAFWKQEKISQGPRNWSALYQQIPSPDEGVYFKRENFFRFDVKDMPSVRKYMSGDFAVSDEAEADNPDFTELGIHGARKEYIDDIMTGDQFDATKLYMCIDGWSGRKAPEAWIHEYFNLVKHHLPQTEFAEVGVIRRSIEGILKQQRLARRALGHIEWMPHIGDKSANARALQSLSELGMVGIANTEHGDYCLEQLIKFPTGKWDDVVDMMALFARAVYEAHPMIEIPGIPEEAKDRYDKAWDDNETDNWKVA